MEALSQECPDLGASNADARPTPLVGIHVGGVVNLSVADRADGREGSAGPVGDARSESCGQAGDFVSDPEAVAHLGAVLGGRQQVATGPEVR
jgi:hypothetical protein